LKPPAPHRAPAASASPFGSELSKRRFDQISSAVLLIRSDEKKWKMPSPAMRQYCVVWT
jgi:hypothetical protein